MMKFLKILGIVIVTGLVLGQFGTSPLKDYVIGFFGGLWTATLVKD